MLLSLTEVLTLERLKVRLGRRGGFVKFVLLFSSLLWAEGLWAQQSGPVTAPQTQTPGDTETNPVTLSIPYNAAERNYFNFYGFANGIYDSNEYLATSSPSGNQTGWGIEGGGGVTGFHEFATGDLALSYRGDYRAYESSAYPSGTDQNLSFLFRKQLTRHWSLAFTQSAGIFLYGGTYFGVQPSNVNFVETSPFSPKTRFLGDSLSLSYQQTRRLSYQFTGDFYLVRYSNGVSYGSTDASGSGTILYRLSRQTTISGTYTHTYFDFQHGAGESDIDSAYLTLSRDLPNHWRVGVSGGISHSNSSGIVNVPVTFLVGTNLLTGYVVGHYHTSTNLPYAQATVSRTMRHSTFVVTGGESVTPGNGFFLDSRNLGVSGLYSYMWRKANAGVGGYYSRLTSISNTASASYGSAAASLNLSYQVLRYLGVDLRYDYIRYDSFFGFAGREDNRISFGIVISSKNVPMTLF